MRDIRRAIRRRYATRKNANKLFHVWDQKHQKNIDTEDMMTMINKLGIKINKDEAYVLLKSADINGDDALDIQEFINLIHSSNDALDVDLNKLSSMRQEIAKGGAGVSLVIDKLTKNASGQYENRLNNQMRLYLQKSSQPIARDCLSEDQGGEGNKTYQINKAKLKVILKHRLNLPEMLKNDDSRLDKLINEYSADGNSELIDYKAMLEDIRGFNYDVESNTAAQRGKNILSPQTESEYSEPIESQRNSLTILNIQKVPFNKEEEIIQRSCKINRILKNYFKTRASLTAHLKNNTDVDKNGTIDLNEFQNLIITTLKDEIENNSIGKKDIECFLSNFVYNKYGHTGVNDIAPKIFSTAEEYNRIISHFKKPQPPPSKVNYGLEKASEKGDDVFKHQKVKILADKIVDKALNATQSKFQ